MASTSSGGNDPAVALAYIEGIIDAYATVGPPIDYCLPKGATYGDVRDAVCKWVSNYPEETQGRRFARACGVARGLALQRLIGRGIFR
ncbi:Rap1a/Tai family immunity protein [Sinorhizobium meliloti]|uniref:Rap1a/Tai family immunity protein n=1 Tax=Rhizobium meliloti TaxID=382 RepID=UPI00238048DB|nr:Rap1a/Tai family immunity protein [Sinorhizobium meliloti]